MTGTVGRPSDVTGHPRRQQARGLLLAFTVLLMVGGLLPSPASPAPAPEHGELLSGTGEDANSAATEPFSDIAGAGVHRANVEILAALGTFEGTECAAGRFCPDQPIPRWVMAVWMVRALDGADPAPMDRSRFADVDGGGVVGGPCGTPRGSGNH